MPAHDQAASTAVTVNVVLVPDVPSDSNNVSFANLPKGEKEVVRLRLVLKSNQPGAHFAELLTIQGQSVFEADSLKAVDSGTEVDFDVPGRLLNLGDYQVRLSLSQARSRENVASYYFRVR